MAEPANDRYQRHLSQFSSEEEMIAAAIKASMEQSIEQKTVIVARHARRMDDDPSAKFFNKDIRPHDCPIHLMATTTLEENCKKIFPHMSDGKAVILTSPFRRCIQTAIFIARKLEFDCEIIVDPALCELRTMADRCFPEGKHCTDELFFMTQEERWRISRTYPEVEVKWPDHMDVPSHPDMATQRIDAINAAIQSRTEQNIFIVTHGDIANAMGPQIDGIDDDSIGLLSLDEAGFFITHKTKFPLSNNDDIVSQFGVVTM